MRRFPVQFACLFFSGLMPASAETVEIASVCGDANSNGSITASDAQTALRTSTELASCPPCICDVNRSSSVTTLDALIILKKAVGQSVATSCAPCAGGQLDSLRWELPCTLPKFPLCPVAENVDSDSTTMLGEPGVTYDVELRFRGVIEQKNYDGGVQDGYFVVGGEPDFTGYNVNRLEISDPPSTYYLNGGISGIQRCWELDITRTIPIRAGATVTLTGDATDKKQVGNTDGTLPPHPIIPPDVPPAPESFSGQFIQMDVISVVEQP